MTLIFQRNLHRRECPTCGDSLYGKILITLTEHKEPVFNFCITGKLFEELHAYLKMRGVEDPIEVLNKFWHDEYRKNGGSSSWCSRVISYRCLLCGKEIEYVGKESAEEFWKHVENCRREK